MLRELVSPGQVYTLVNTDSDRKPHHTLSVRNNRTGGIVTLLNYDRSVTAIWSPAGDRLAVTDHFASNESRCLVFHMGQKVPVVSLGDAVLAGRAPPESRTEMRENDHVYIEALRWDGDSSLRFRIWGYGAGRRFTHTYVYSFISNVVSRGPR